MIPPDDFVLTDVAAIAVAAAGTAFAALVIYRSTRTSRIITPAYVFFGYYVVFVLVGGLMLIAERGAGSYYHHPGTQNLGFLVVILSGLPLFAGGVWLANRQLGFTPRPELRSFLDRPWTEAAGGLVANLLFVLLAAVCVGVAILVFFARPSPLILLVMHLGSGSLTNDLALHDARLATLSPEAGGLPYQALLYQFYGNLLPLLALLAFAWSRLLRRSRWAYIAGLLLVPAVVLAANAVTKNPVVNLAILMYVGWHAFVARPVDWRIAAPFAGGLAGVFFAIVWITNRSVPLPIIVWATLHRLVMVQVDVLYSVFELVPSHTGFLQGRALWMDITNLRPGPKSTLDFGAWLYNQIVPDHPEMHNLGSAPTTFIGQFYADFGIPAAMLAMLVAGYLCQLVYIRYLRGPKNAVRWVVFVGLTASIPRLTTSSLIAIAFEYGILASLLLGVYFRGGERLLVPIVRALRGSRSAVMARPGSG